MSDLTLSDALEELSSAEDFLDFFAIEYDPKVVQVNRLHIMQRFHDYLEQGRESLPDEVLQLNEVQLLNEEQKAALREVYRTLLERAYQDFVESDALTEKVFKVFHMHEPQTTFVPLDQLLES